MDSKIWSSNVVKEVQGTQPEENFFNVLDIQLEQNGEYVNGHLHVVFQCKMYLDRAGKLTGDFVRDLSGEYYIPINYKL
ncbi:MAG TPA: hypothetical protein VFG10_16550 [Saprospiraceae bacterium]|nr:hypothetical protein [Saprospiraceae bacterium]